MTQSYIVNDGSLVFGAPGDFGEIAAQVTSCQFTPSTDVGDPTPVLDGSEIPGDRETTWVVEGNWLQDISETGITTWTLENAGQSVPVVFIPNDVTARSVSGTIIVDPTSIGGEVKSRANSDFEFSLVGQPALGDVV